MATKAELKKNHDEMLSMIQNINNPKARDVDYLEGVLKSKQYNTMQKKKLQRMLNELRESIPPEEEKKSSNAIEFAEDSTVGKRRKAAETAKAAKDLAESAPGESNGQAEKKEKKKSKIKVVDKATEEMDKAVEAAPSDRTELFLECQKELNELGDKYLALARKHGGPISSRLTIVSNDMKRHARQTLRL